MPKVKRAFFEVQSPIVARKAIGQILVRVADGSRLSGRIVETEAYRGSRDPASHAFHGMTRRNEVMFGEPGHAYIYFTYGAHYCLNLTCEPRGTAAAVLVRAIEPCEGIEEMKKNRGVENTRDIASGPGKLTKALSIDRSLNGEDLIASDKLFLEVGKIPLRVKAGPRIGIGTGTEFPWRFFEDGCEFVSRTRPQGATPRIHNYRGLRSGQIGVVG